MKIKKYICPLFDSAFNIATRLKLANTPIIGTSLDVIYTESVQSVKDIMINQTIEDLDYSKVDKDFLYSSEFSELLMKALEIAFNEINKEKLIFYSKLIKNSLESSPTERRYNLDYIKVICDLSIEQMYILNEIYKQQKNIFEIQEENPDLNDLQLVKECTDWENLSSIIKTNYDIDYDDFQFLLKRIESTGLIHEVIGAFWDYEGGIYIITPTLIKIFEKLEIYE